MEIEAARPTAKGPGEWHWHGATDSTFMTHLALSEAVPAEDGPAVTWGEHVTDAEYRSAHDAAPEWHGRCCVG